MKLKTVLCIGLIVPCVAIAKQSVEVKPGTALFLQQACREYIELYAQKDDERFGAFLTTSKSESFRAGYCLGVITVEDNSCSYGSTYNKAKKIAHNEVNSRMSINRYIRDSLCY